MIDCFSVHLLLTFVVVLPQSLWSQSAGHVLGHVNRCGCHSNRFQWQEHPYLGPGLRQLPQVYTCTRRPV